MIKANELRIGNYLQDMEHPFIVTVNELVYINDHKEHGYEPIPLTEEWLVKFGFEKNYINIMELGVLFLYVSGDEYSFAPSTRDDEEYFNVKLQYVNQLQNLYFSLTSQELKLQS